MIINVIKQEVKEKIEDRINERVFKRINEMASYKIKDIKPCCPSIVSNPLINIQHEYIDEYYSDGYINAYETSDNEEYGVMLEHCEANGDTEWYSYYKIRYCPFCGDAVVINVVDTIDVTDEYVQLKTKRNELNFVRSSCDSKKQTSELSDKIRELDDKIDLFYYSDEFPEFDRLEFNIK